MHDFKTNQVELREDQLAAELRTMGFEHALVQEAIVHCSTADDAVDWLLARS